MAKKEELNLVINVVDSSNTSGNVEEKSTSLSSLTLDNKSNCLSPLSANAPHSITWSSNLSNSSTRIQGDSRHPQLSNSFSGFSGLTTAALLNQCNAPQKRDTNCSKASLSSLINSSEGSLCVQAPSLPALEGFRELDASGNISQCNRDDNSLRVSEENLPVSISCPSLINVDILPSSSSRRLLVMTNVPRANSTFDMPAGDQAQEKSESLKQTFKLNQKLVFGANYFHGQYCQLIGQTSLSPYLVRKTLKLRPSASGTGGTASPSITFPSNYKRKCEDWLGESGSNP